MIEINELTIPTKGTAKYLNVTANGFSISPTNGITIYWSLHSQGSRENEEGETEYYPSGNLLEGNLQFPQEQYDLWGTDDTHVTDWVLTELGLTEATAE